MSTAALIGVILLVALVVLARVAGLRKAWQKRPRNPSK